MTLIVLVFVCKVGQSICDQNTARVYQPFVAPPGMVICNASMIAPSLVKTAVAPGDDEYIKTKCVLR